MREAFPEELQGMYSSEEMNTEIDDTMVTVDVPEEEQAQMMPEPQPEPVEVMGVTEMPTQETELSTMDELGDVF